MEVEEQEEEQRDDHGDAERHPLDERDVTAELALDEPEPDEVRRRPDRGGEAAHPVMPFMRGALQHRAAGFAKHAREALVRPQEHMDRPLQPEPLLGGDMADLKKYVKATLNLSPSIDYTKLKVGFLNATSMQGPLFNVSSTGAVAITDSLLTGNTQYKILVMYNMDDLLNLTNASVTVSDYTTAFSEFLQQNLDGTFKNAAFTTGIGYKAADVNRSDALDGGDVAKLFTHVSGVANLVTLPSQYTVGSGGFMSLLTFKASEYNASTPADCWVEIRSWFCTAAAIPR